MTALERNCEIQPIRKAASRRYAAPETSAVAMTSCTAAALLTPAVVTAAPASAAKAELGPVATCRLVPKTA